MRVRYSLFVRFFMALVGLAVLPMMISGAFIIASYQVRLTSTEIGGVNISEALFRDVAIQLFLIFLFVFIIATFAAFVLSRNIVRPLQILTEAVRRIAAGNLNIKINVKRKDEIGTLGSFFNEMVGRIKETTQRQEEISRLKSEFVSIAAHQLRTPLSAMKWTHHTLLDGDAGELPKEARELLKKAQLANDQMIKLVGNLLDVARIEEGRYGYTFRKVDIVPMIKELVDERRFIKEKKGINIKLDLNSITSLPISADEERLTIALSNILDNALKYTRKGGVTVALALQRGDRLRITITDTGVGIDDRDASRMFTKFYRGENVVKLETEGTGLGLFISRNIILRHGGKIWFESKKGKGTTFSIELPTERNPALKYKPSFESFVESI